MAHHISARDHENTGVPLPQNLLTGAAALGVEALLSAAPEHNFHLFAVESTRLRSYDIFELVIYLTGYGY